MELIPDPKRLNTLLQGCRFPETHPWIYRYPWQLRRYAKGEYLCRYRESVPFLLLLLSGKVTVSISPPHGRTHIITYCAPGSLICGDVEVALGNTLATADLRSVEGDVWCASIPIAPHRKTLLSDLDFLRCTIQRLAREMVKDTCYAANNLLFPLEDRLGAYLIYNAEDDVFRGNLTRIAELLGVSYRHLSRVMGSFVERGWLEKISGGWRILSPAPLEKMAEQMDEPPITE